MPARHRPVPTLATVAEAAGVSRQTVSNALKMSKLRTVATSLSSFAQIVRIYFVRSSSAVANDRPNRAHICA